MNDHHTAGEPFQIPADRPPSDQVGGLPAATPRAAGPAHRVGERFDPLVPR